MTLIEFWLLGVAVIATVAATPWAVAGITALFVLNEPDEDKAAEIVGNAFAIGHIVGVLMGLVVLTLGVLLH